MCLQLHILFLARHVPRVNNGVPDALSHRDFFNWPWKLTSDSTSSSGDMTSWRKVHLIHVLEAKMGNYVMQKL